MHCSTLQYVAARCSTLQCLSTPLFYSPTCCSCIMLQRVAVRCNVSTHPYSIVQQPQAWQQDTQCPVANFCSWDLGRESSWKGKKCWIFSKFSSIVTLHGESCGKTDFWEIVPAICCVVKIFGIYTGNQKTPVFGLVYWGVSHVNTVGIFSECRCVAVCCSISQNFEECSRVLEHLTSCNYTVVHAYVYI